MPFLGQSGISRIAALRLSTSCASISPSFNQERNIRILHWNIYYVEALHAGEGGTLFHLLDEFRDILFASLHHNFNRGIRAVSHVPGQIQSLADMPDEITETDALNPAVHGDLLCLHRHALT